MAEMSSLVLTEFFKERVYMYWNLRSVFNLSTSYAV